MKQVNSRKYYCRITVYNSWHKDSDFNKVVLANATDLNLLIDGPVVMRVVE